jgi:hypothetical protein
MEPTRFLWRAGWTNVERNSTEGIPPDFILIMMVAFQNGIGLSGQFEIIARLGYPIEVNFAQGLTRMGHNDLGG